MERLAFIGPSGANLFGKHIGQQVSLAARAAVKPKLVKNALEVVFDRRLRQMQLRGNLRVCPPCGGKLGNFQFAWAEAAIIRLCCAVQNGLRCRISGKNLRQKGAEIRCMLGKRQV